MYWLPKLAASSATVFSTAPVLGSICCKCPGLTVSITHSLPCASTATSLSAVPATSTRITFSATAADVPPAVLTVTAPAPKVLIAARRMYTLLFCAPSYQTLTASLGSAASISVSVWLAPAIRYVLAPSTYPEPNSTTRSWMSTCRTTGTICNSGWLAEPSTCSLNAPLAYAGMSSCAFVPSALAWLGLSRTICAVPWWSTQRSNTSVAVLSPTPTSLTVCPALADACAPSAGAPL